MAGGRLRKALDDAVAHRRAALWPERKVKSPDGREWRVRVHLYRPPSPPADEDSGVFDELTRAPLFGPFAVLSPLARVLRVTVVPVLEATVGRRPWIEASAGPPPITMVWRATGRQDASTAVDEIAGALARGEDRPVPLSARWVGYDRGFFTLHRKI